MVEPLREETPEKWQEGLLQRPASCACRFEWRPTPDFSGVPPKQLDECGFHAMQRTTLERELHEVKEQSTAQSDDQLRLERALAESERKLEQARQDELEEAAKVCEQRMGYDETTQIARNLDARDIRALASTKGG